jgi:hypothetical protein
MDHVLFCHRKRRDNLIISDALARQISWSQYSVVVNLTTVQHYNWLNCLAIVREETKWSRLRFEKIAILKCFARIKRIPIKVDELVDLPQYDDEATVVEKALIEEAKEEEIVAATIQPLAEEEMFEDEKVISKFLCMDLWQYRLWSFTFWDTTN